MNIRDLADHISNASTAGNLDSSVVDVTHDSRQCQAGSVFAAIRGLKTDAHIFIPRAIELGAIAVISENNPLNYSTAWIQVPDARIALAEAAAAVHNHPSRRLKLVGITGTNGKTTSAHLIDSIIRAVEGNSAIFGTINCRVGRRMIEAHNTTPEASDIQRMLAEAVEHGCKSAVMEVSSQAIEFHRADELTFAVAVFTNLTRDHLDYHGTMDNYFAAKLKLFHGELGPIPPVSIINTDDEYGRKLLDLYSGRILTYGLGHGADVTAEEYDLSANGLSFTAKTPMGEVTITSSLTGRPHVYNILASIATGVAAGFDLDGIAHGIAACKGVPGRFEKVRSKDDFDLGFAVVVDYAHTDDALKNLLKTAREVITPPARVITVFGCGGDRDRSKRALMGEAASLLSDIVIVTSDNPRTEEPEAIIRDIETGMKSTGKSYTSMVNRREAINHAINQARPGDIVVIAGKGHETYQIIGNEVHGFDDREVAREAMRELALQRNREAV